MTSGRSTPPQPLTAAEALEMAAKVCDDVWREDEGTPGSGSSAACAIRIRALAASLSSSPTEGPHSEEDGFGNGWECTKGLPTGKCGMQIIRPGHVQCDICDAPVSEKPAIPEGFVLVPREPTNAMMAAGAEASVAHEKLLEWDGERRSHRVYRAMLAAAPAPSGGEEEPK